MLRISLTWGGGASAPLAPPLNPTLQLEKISRTCITRWRSLPPYLDVSSITIDDIDHDSNKEEEKRNDFSDWKLKNGSRATYRKLLHGLLEIGCRDDAEKVCRLLRESVSTLEQNSATGRRSVEKSLDSIASQSASDSGQLGPIGGWGGGGGGGVEGVGITSLTRLM